MTDLASLTAGVLADEEEQRGTADTAAGRGGTGGAVGDRDRAQQPGADEEEMPLRKGLALGGGAFTFLILALLNSLDELEASAMQVLGPEIGDALNVSDGVIVFITSASAAFIVLGVVPMGWLADRVRRGPIVGISSLVFGLMAVLSGLATNAFLLFWARFGSGMAKANTIPVHSSLLADTYPIGVRGRIFSTIGTAGRIAAVASPVLVGAVASLFGGADDGGWRWSFVLLGLPVSLAAFAAFRIKEPPRGQWERRSVVGSVPADDVSVPISFEMAFNRLGQIKTLRVMVFALAAVGLQLFPMVSMTYFFLEEEYDLDAFDRGLVTAAAGALAVIVLPYVGRRFDQIYRESPPRAMRILAAVILPGALLTPVQFNMPNAWLFTLVWMPGSALVFAAFTLVSPLVQGVVPHRLRSLGAAYAAVYVFLFGAIGGSLAGGALADSHGEKVAIITLAIPSAVVGAVLVLRGSLSIDDDLVMIVDDIGDEEAERERQQADPEAIPMLQLSDVDFSYGSVQVLFDVNLSVAKGETLALLGTNGAGKSTILRVVAGLGMPSRGAVRLAGRTITFTSPEQRNAMGVQLLPGGEGVFPSLSVSENLEMGAHALDRSIRAERIDRVWELFPELRRHAGRKASSLSGGQQQQVALGRVLLHDPELLLIDELSLGLAPTVVEELLGVVERLKADGQTMVIVEQSLNVALSIADRAVFLEKGSVHFDGPARELAERDDLARAVFLGAGR